MPNPRLAARYAKSLIDLAIERDILEDIYADMLHLQSICQYSREFVNLLKSPIIHASKKEAIIEAVTKDKVNALTAGFNRLLIQKGREAYLPEIITAFIDQYKSYKEIYTVLLTTATPASEELKKNIVEKVKAQTNMKHIELKTEVKEDIIGGFVLQLGDLLVDASVAYDLNKIKAQFMNNDFIYKLR